MKRITKNKKKTLEAQMEKVVGKETPQQKQKKETILQDLSERLRKIDPVGVVGAIIFYDDAKGFVVCCGHQIDERILFSKLNLSISTTIKRWPIYRLNAKRCQQGHFVHLNDIEPVGEDKYWVALVGINVVDDDLIKAIPYG